MTQRKKDMLHQKTTGQDPKILHVPKSMTRNEPSKSQLLFPFHSNAMDGDIGGG